MKKIIRRLDLFFAIMLFAVYSVVIAAGYILPNEVSTNNSNKIEFLDLFTISYNEDELVGYQGAVQVSANEREVKLLNIIPIKTVTVSQTPLQNVYVSGESFGIKLYTDGVIIVGTKDVELDGITYNPAKQAGLQKGDIIVSINNYKTNTSQDVERIFNNNSGTDYEIKIKRENEYKTFILKPVYSSEDDSYKVGLWVRDSTAGIGTITFFNPKNNSMAALGHPITDVDTNEIMPILNGEAVKANITKIYKSSEGETGSICCEFTNDTIGTLTINNSSGIYGKYSGEISSAKSYPVALAQDVEKGDAQILCTVDENGPKLYDVEITRISYRNSEGKNLVIKVKDPALIEITGGIVQGMSGSPIIQNGKLVGALTHVIVDNPEKGYGIFAEKMLTLSNTVE